MATVTDLSKSVFSENSWHIVPAKYVNSWVSIDRESVIVHQCPEWTQTAFTETGILYNKLGYWATSEHVETPCKLCNRRPPEAVAQLFLLHNFDTFAKDGMSRVVSGIVNKAYQGFDRQHFLGEHYTEIGVDR